MGADRFTDDRRQSLFAVSRRNLISPEIDLFGRILEAERGEPQMPTFSAFDGSQDDPKGPDIRKKLTNDSRRLIV